MNEESGNLFNDAEKKFLRIVVERHLENFRETEESILDPDLRFLEGAYNYEKFIEDILEKLK